MSVFFLYRSRNNKNVAKQRRLVNKTGIFFFFCMVFALDEDLRRKSTEQNPLGKFPRKDR